MSYVDDLFGASVEQSPPTEGTARHAAGRLSWRFYLAYVLFRVLNALYWTLTCGLGWGLGAALGSLMPWPEAVPIGRAAGLALALLAMLTMGLGQKGEYTPFQLSGFGGAALGSATLLLLDPFPRDWNFGIGAVLGFVVGLFTAVMRQWFAPVGFLPACVAAVLGSAIFTTTGMALENTLGTAAWGAAGGLSLCLVAVFAESFRRRANTSGLDESEANHSPTRDELLRNTLTRCWSLTDPVAWGWNGLIGGLIAAHWASWAAAHPNAPFVRTPILVCGGLAAVVLLAARLGVATGKKAPSTRNEAG